MSDRGVNVGMYSLLLAVALCSCRPVIGASLLDWIGLGGSPENRDLTVRDGVPLLKVPFEEASPEEKFLREAEKYVGLKQSELDSCQHKVVMKIRSSCASISEEELAKLSVNLLNCQSAVEGRQQFPCTENMSLRDCTNKMDSDMWNTYHLMNNRARAVCYAARHQQFRALSEMTVNKLMTTAHDQLIAMEGLKDGQSKLETMTAGTLDSVSKGHQTLMAEQEKLRSTQQSVHDFVALNLRELTREKALIAAGQRELSLMTKEVKSKLDEASQKLSEQAIEREKNHLQVLADLENLQNKAFEIWDRVDASTTQILAQHAVAAEDLEHMLLNLARLNSTIEFLLKTVEKTRSDIDERLGWIIKFIGESGEQMEWMQQCLSHGLYLVLGMVAASFLQAPFAVRCALLMVVPLNLVLTSYEGSEAALDFPGISILILVFAGIHWVLTTVQEMLHPQSSAPLHYIQGDPSWQHQHTSLPVRNGSSPNSVPSVPVSASESAPPYSSIRSLLSFSSLQNCWYQFRCKTLIIYRDLVSWLNQVFNGSNSNSSQSHEVSNEARNENSRDEVDSDNEGSIDQEIRFASQRHLSDLPLRSNVSLLRSDSRSSSRSSRSFTPVRSGTPKAQCLGRTKTGQPCRNFALAGSEMCRSHSISSPSRG